VTFLAAHTSGYVDDMSIRTGTTVTWRWGAGTAEGTVTAIHPRPVVRRIKGVRVKRLGTPDDPAYEIEQADGSKVLKLRSEVDQKHKH
jgi:hypothetical protein